MNLIEERRLRDREYYREYKRLCRLRNPSPPKVLSTSYAATASRKYREKRRRDGWLAVWMIGYDGPSPYPASAWSMITEYARVYGLG